jgi:hypothetical protein
MHPFPQRLDVRPMEAKFSINQAPTPTLFNGFEVRVSADEDGILTQIAKGNIPPNRNSLRLERQTR